MKYTKYMQNMSCKVSQLYLIQTGVLFGPKFSFILVFFASKKLRFWILGTYKKVYNPFDESTYNVGKD